jgi:hypothetical protein
MKHVLIIIPLALILSANRALPTGFEVLTAVAIKNSLSWVIMPRSPLKINRLFGGTHRI